MSDSNPFDCPLSVLLPDRCCRCAEALVASDFRDSASFREFENSGLCRYCQDLAWMGFTVGDDGVPRDQYFLRRGVVFAQCQRGQSALLPFVFGAPGPFIGWEFTAVVLVGQFALGGDPSASLTSLSSYMATHRLGVSVVDSPSDARLDSLGRVAVVLGFQSGPLEQFVDSCPVLRASVPALHQLEVFADDDSPRRVDLFDLIVACGLDPGYDPAAGPPDALRLCAWTVCALHTSDGDRILLDRLLANHRRLVAPAPRAVPSAPLH